MRKILVAMALVFGLCVGTVQAADPLAGRTQLSEVSSAEIKAAIEAAKGKTVVLNFFASWCPPCLHELPDLIKLRQTVSPDKLFILGVAVGDKPADLKKLADKMNFNYPVFMGADEVSEVYGIEAIPYNIVYSPTGEIEYADSGVINCEVVRKYAESGGKQ